MMRAASGYSAASSSRIPSATERMFPSMLTPREQGDIGERSALYWLIEQGAKVSIRFGHSPDYDFRHGRWEVGLATYGGNQSWTGLVKRLDASRCDYLFVLVGDGHRWFIPSQVLGGGRCIRLGGPKYAHFEVARGDRITGRTAGGSASTIDSLDPRGDVRAAKGVAL